MLQREKLQEAAERSYDRTELWVRLLTEGKVEVMAELGVQRGLFAQSLLRECSALRRYYMIDPWRHLDNWNKPSNKATNVHEEFYAETLRNTEQFAAKRVVLRGTTAEVIDRITDGELDFAYIDGDHTLRGITIDLACAWPKIKEGGFIGGDDFCCSIWQHSPSFEPTLVFPYAVHFAEAHSARVYALPFSQFLIEKSGASQFEFVDLVNKYGRQGLRDQWPSLPASRLSLLRRAKSTAGRAMRRLGLR